MKQPTIVVPRTIKAIPTHYKGCHFRSRLEARYAVFFDSMGISWRYEPQGYTLPDGTNYLPDFYLPMLDDWAEIKGQTPTKLEMIRMAWLAMSTGKTVLCLWDFPEESKWHLTVFLATDNSALPYILDGNIIWRRSSFIDKILQRPTLWIQDRRTRHFLPFPLGTSITYKGLVAATTAARSARFEFGQSG